MAAPLAELKVLEVDAHHAKGTLGNMLFMVWRYETQTAAYVRARAILAELGQQFPAGVVLMQAIEPTASPPDAKTRAELPKLLDLAERYVRHSSILHEGTGFKAAAVRTITSAAYLMSRRRFPQQVFSSLSEAASWHALHPGGPSPNAFAITSAVRTLRERIAQQAPPG